MCNALALTEDSNHIYTCIFEQAKGCTVNIVILYINLCKLFLVPHKCFVLLLTFLQLCSAVEKTEIKVGKDLFCDGVQLSVKKIKKISPALFSTYTLWCFIQCPSVRLSTGIQKMSNCRRRTPPRKYKTAFKLWIFKSTDAPTKANKDKSDVMQRLLLEIIQY